MEQDRTPLEGTAPPDRVKKFCERWKGIEEVEREATEKEKAKGEAGEQVEEEAEEAEMDKEEEVIKDRRVKPRREWAFYVQAH